MGQLDPATLTPAQRDVLAAWPDFEDAAAVKWTTVDRVVKVFTDAASLAELSDHDARDLEALMRRTTTRLRTMTRIADAMRPRPAPSARGRA